MKNILEGVRVLELGQVLAGLFAGAILADLGAEVIKLERVDGGDDARHMGQPFRHGDALSFHIFNRGKKSVAIDLRAAEGRAAFERLASTADILIHNLRPGVTKTLGIDGEASLRAPSAIDLLRDFGVWPHRSNEPVAGLRAVDPGLQRPVEHQRRL